MTGTLLASLAADGTLGLDDAVSTWLDGGANGGITLRRLVTHTSGLPGVPPNYDLCQTDRLNPWAAFTPELAAQGLRQAEVRADPGWRYSNFGYQLVGLVLERASGEDYPSLLSERLLRPLEMTGSAWASPTAPPSCPGMSADARYHTETTRCQGLEASTSRSTTWPCIPPRAYPPRIPL